MTLHPQQIKERDQFIKCCPNEDERLALCIGMAKTCSYLSSFIAEIDEFIEVPREIKYKAALLLNFCMGIWLSKVEVEGTVMAEYKTKLSKQDIDDRFQQVFMFLYDEAKKQGWVK